MVCCCFDLLGARLHTGNPVSPGFGEMSTWEGELTAPHEPQVLDEPLIEAPHLGQDELCMLGGLLWGVGGWFDLVCLEEQR